MVERTARLQVAEHPLVVALEGRAGTVLEQLAGQAPESDRAFRLLGLRRVWLVAHPRLTDAHRGAGGIGEGNVPPPQAENLAAAQAGTKDGEEHDSGLLDPGTVLPALRLGELLKGPLDAADFDGREDRPASARLAWPLDRANRIRSNEPLRLRRLEKGMEEVQVPVARPRGELPLAVEVALQVLDSDRGQPELGELGDQRAVSKSDFRWHTTHKPASTTGRSSAMRNSTYCLGCCARPRPSRTRYSAPSMRRSGPPTSGHLFLGVRHRRAPVHRRQMTVTNPDKVFFPERGETKLDVIRYYLAVSEPFLHAADGRPTLMQRFRTGRTGALSSRSAFPTTGRSGCTRGSRSTSATGPRVSRNAPWPPVYPKQPDEPLRVAPSRARREAR